MGRDILTSIKMHNSGNLKGKSNCGNHYKGPRIHTGNDMKIFSFLMRPETIFSIKMMDWDERIYSCIVMM